MTPPARRKKRQVKAMAKHDVMLILSALCDAINWQDSIHDAHYRSLEVWNRTKENTAIARGAYRLLTKYKKLSGRIRSGQIPCCLSERL